MRPISERPERWAIWIDIEGFKFLHDAHNPQALAILGRLIEDIFLVGNLVYQDSPDRLFIHQIGDGFVIVSDFMEETLDRPLAIAITLMMSLLIYGALGRSGISSGDWEDILGCYPQSVRENYKDHGLPVGHGIMSITTVMGGALINAYRTACDGPKGPSLRIDSKFADKLASIEGLVITERTDQSIGINWLASNLPLADSIAGIIRGQAFDREQLRKSLEWYIREFDGDLKCSWKKNAKKLLLQASGSDGI